MNDPYPSISGPKESTWSPASIPGHTLCHCPLHLPLPLHPTEGLLQDTRDTISRHTAQEEQCPCWGAQASYPGSLHIVTQGISVDVRMSLHLHHACTLFYREQEESLLNRIMTTKYLVTDYIAGQHDPDRNAMWSFARKPGYLWETVISHLWATAAPSPAVYQGSALSNQPGLSKYEGYGYNSRRVRGWQKLLYCKGLVPPCIPQPAVLLDLQRRLSMGLHHP